MKDLQFYLNSSVFVIPNNQRGYSWGTANFDDLVNDLKLAGDNNHYLGPVIVTKTEETIKDDIGANIVVYNLDDGQQRITTFMIAVAEIYHKLLDIDEGLNETSLRAKQFLFYTKNGKATRKLQNSNANLDIVLEKILERSDVGIVEPSPPIRNLLVMQEHISGFFDGLERQDLVEWLNKLISQALFIQVDLSSEKIDRYLAFDAINSRGLPLSEFDKIKNFSILVCQELGIEISPEEEWYKAICNLEEFDVASRNHEGHFITHYYAIFYNEIPNQNEIHHKFVNRYRDLIAAEKPETLHKSLKNQFVQFIQGWADAAKSYAVLTSKDKNRLRALSLLDDKAVLWLKRLDNLDLVGITKYVLMASYLVKGNSDDFAAIAEYCEKYSFRVHSVIGKRVDFNRQPICSLANEILKNNLSTAEILVRIALWLRDNADINDVIQKIGDGTPKYNHSSKFNGWNACYYFLYEYDVSKSAKGTQPVSWASAKTKQMNSQEHILPQSFESDEAYWLTQFSNPEQGYEYLHRIGNLVLTQGNSTLGNKSFPEKLNGNGKSNYFYKHSNATNSEKEISKFTDGNSWGSQNIVLRELDMLKFAAERWSINHDVDNCKILLPEEFDCTISVTKKKWIPVQENTDQ